jgi:hypothetical protein
MALQPFVGPWPLFSFLILYTVDRTSWTRDQPVTRPLPTHRTTQTQNKSTQTSMPRFVFEPMIPMFEQAKTVHVLDRAAIVIGRTHLLYSIIFNYIYPIATYTDYCSPAFVSTSYSFILTILSHLSLYLVVYIPFSAIVLCP